MRNTGPEELNSTGFQTFVKGKSWDLSPEVNRKEAASGFAAAEPAFGTNMVLNVQTEASSATDQQSHQQSHQQRSVLSLLEGWRSDASL